MHLNGPKGLIVVASSLALVAVLLTACGSTSAEVQVKTATPVSGETRSSETQTPKTVPSKTVPSKSVPSKTVPSSHSRPPTTENHAPGTADQSPGTAAQHPDTEAPLPSINKQAEAQALIDEVPKLVGDSGVQRKSTQIDDALKAGLQRIADGKAGGDNSFFTAIEKLANAGQVVNPYLICPLADGDGCSASKQDFDQYMQTCVGDTTQWTAVLVPGADGWAAAGVCLWKPSDAEKAAALDTASKAIIAAATGSQPLSRDPSVDAAAQAWAAAPASTSDPSTLPAFSAFKNIVTDSTGIQSPGQITNGNLTSLASQSSVTSFTSGITRFGLATVVDNGALEILIVGVD